MSEIVLEQRIEASPADVYAYLTDEGRWKRWQGADATLDPRVGGVLSVLMANGMNARGEFVELVPDRRVVFTWGWIGYENLPPGASTVEIDLRADGDATVLVLTHRSIPDDEVPSQRAGWAHYLPRLALVASGGDPGADPSPSVHQAGDSPPIDPTAPPSGTGCVECLRAGGWWLHLRRCAACGHIGCCNSSPSQHAQHHAFDAGHPVITSFEPGENWFWDYLAGDVVAGPPMVPPLHHPLDQPVPGPRGQVPANWESLLHD